MVLAGKTGGYMGKEGLEAVELSMADNILSSSREMEESDDSSSESMGYIESPKLTCENSIRIGLDRNMHMQNDDEWTQDKTSKEPKMTRNHHPIEPIKQRLYTFLDEICTEVRDADDEWMRDKEKKL